MKQNIKYGISMIILILIAGIIIFATIKKSKINMIQGENKISTEEINGKSDQEDKVSNSKVEIESYNGKDTFLYKYTIYNAQGEAVYSEKDLYREPIIKELGDDIISIGHSAGTGLFIVQYYDKLNDKFSEVFTNPLDLKNNKVIYFTKNNLVVQNIYKKSKYYKKIKLNATDTADPSNVIKSAKFIDDNTIRVTYFTGTDYKEVTETLQLN